MIRTQIYIPETIHNKLMRIAEAQGTAMAQLVRTFIEDGLKRTEDVDYSGKTALQNILNIHAQGGPRDLSVNHDHYLYGGPKKS